MKLILALFLFSNLAFSLDYGKCSKLLNNGWWKTYEYGGIDQPLTKATKKHGSSKGTSATTTEATTALSDPGYYSNVSTSETQSSSSFGACSALGMKQMNEAREMYFVQNKDEIIDQIAKGAGEHLDVLAAYSLCEDNSLADFKQQLQSNTSSFLAQKQIYGQVVDQAIKEKSSLTGKCLTYF